MSPRRDTAPRHTEGPWKVEPFDSGFKTIHIRAPGVVIDYDDVDHAQQRANAALVSAAPDLLEACKRGLEWLRDFSAERPSDPLDNVLAQLDAAIRKATRPVREYPR